MRRYVLTLNRATGKWQLLSVLSQRLDPEVVRAALNGRFSGHRYKLRVRYARTQRTLIEDAKQRAARQRKKKVARVTPLEAVHAELRRTRAARNAEAVRRFAEYERELQITMLERAIAKIVARRRDGRVAELRLAA